MSGRAGTVTSIAAAETPTDNSGSVVVPAGAGGSGFCHGGGGSQAQASDVPSGQLPSWGGQWLTTADQTSGRVSLFFFKASQGPPPVPDNGATIDEIQPTLGLAAGRSGSFAYRVTDTKAGTTYLASPSTSNVLWTIPDGAR